MSGCITKKNISKQQCKDFHILPVLFDIAELNLCKCLGNILVLSSDPPPPNIALAISRGRGFMCVCVCSMCVFCVCVCVCVCVC